MLTINSDNGSFSFLFGNGEHPGGRADAIQYQGNEQFKMVRAQWGKRQVSAVPDLTFYYEQNRIELGVKWYDFHEKIWYL